MIRDNLAKDVPEVAEGSSSVFEATARRRHPALAGRRSTRSPPRSATRRRTRSTDGMAETVAWFSQSPAQARAEAVITLGAHGRRRRVAQARAQGDRREELAISAQAHRSRTDSVLKGEPYGDEKL